MDALLHSFALVALAEIGDKTQLLSILLAARFRVFWPIILGILAATLLNHAGAAYAGNLLGGLADSYWTGVITSVLFIAIGLWLLIPDKDPEEAGQEPKYGAFLTSVIAFFIAEMGDKTQLATVTLGAEYASTVSVVLGTTLGMLAANIPAVLFGEAILRRIPLKAVRMCACLLFVGFGAFGLFAA
ncbi:MAG: TMEM165/GDT1 family protein [Alphaproteobacteria bacterium]|nr:TMEM165/GDT1 family protein [Alphaproteobacteria bacterium]